MGLVVVWKLLGHRVSNTFRGFPKIKNRKKSPGWMSVQLNTIRLFFGQKNQSGSWSESSDYNSLRWCFDKVHDTQIDESNQTSDEDEERINHLSPLGWFVQTDWPSLFTPVESEWIRGSAHVLCLLQNSSWTRRCSETVHISKSPELFVIWKSAQAHLTLCLQPPNLWWDISSNCIGCNLFKWTGLKWNDEQILSGYCCVSPNAPHELTD